MITPPSRPWYGRSLLTDLICFVVVVVIVVPKVVVGATTSYHANQDPSRKKSQGCAAKEGCRCLELFGCDTVMLPSGCWERPKGPITKNEGIGCDLIKSMLLAVGATMVRSFLSDAMRE
jgi:hypothetical protein